MREVMVESETLIDGLRLVYVLWILDKNGQRREPALELGTMSKKLAEDRPDLYERFEAVMTEGSTWLLTREGRGRILGPGPAAPPDEEN